MEKRCFKCLTVKPLTEFYRHAAMGDGHLNKCKECTKADVKQRRQDDLEYVRAYDRMRSSMPHRVAQRKNVIKRWASNHPKRKAAQSKLRRAVLSGYVKKQPCHVCGLEKAEAHHPDYDRPLDVVWLCRPHHMQAHAIGINK